MPIATDASADLEPSHHLEPTVLLFARAFATVFLAAMLVTSGVAHLWRFAAFRAVLRSHGVVPATLVTMAAMAVTLGEIAAGVLLLTAAWSGANALAAGMFAACALGGAAFLFYVRRLLRSPRPVSTCGCSPLASPVTYASLVPAGALLVVALAGLVATWLDASWRGAGDFVARVGASGHGLAPDSLLLILPVVWGLTLTGLVWLVPAAVGLEDA